MSEIVYIISPDTLKERTRIHSNVDEKLIYPAIETAQDVYIKPLLGSALFNKIISEISAATLTAKYKELVDDHLVKVLCWYTMYDMVLEGTYQFWNIGVVKKTAQNTESPSMQEIMSYAKNFKNKAEVYAGRTRDYLLTNAAQYFTEFLNPGSGADTIIPNKENFTMPIYLGDDFDLNKKCCR